MGTIESSKCTRCEKKGFGFFVDNLPHHMYHCPDSRAIWETLTEIFNENQTYLYIDENIAILNFVEFHEHNYRRLEICNSKRFDYTLTPQSFNRKLKDMCEIFASFHSQRHNFIKIFVYLTFCEIEAWELKCGPSIDSEISLVKINYNPFVNNNNFLH